MKDQVLCERQSVVAAVLVRLSTDTEGSGKMMDILQYGVIKSVEQSPSWEANGSTASQEIPRI